MFESDALAVSTRSLAVYVACAFAHYVACDSAGEPVCWVQRNLRHRNGHGKARFKRPSELSWVRLSEVCPDEAVV